MLPEAIETINMSRIDKNTPPQFFILKQMFKKKYVFLKGDVLRHALSQRLRPGETFRAVVESHPHRKPNNASDYVEVVEVTVETVSKKHVVGLVSNTVRIKLPSYALHLYPSVLKGGKFDLVVEKATELGVASINPVITARTIPRLNQKKMESKKARWMKIARSASEQSGRLNIPKISEIVEFNHLMDVDLPGVSLLALERGEIVKTVIKAIGHVKEVSIFIGPEGGFDGLEIKSALEKGLQPVTLGPNILRAETASIAACAIIMEHIFKIHK